MDLVSIFLLIIVVIAFGAIGYYFINDYLNYKDNSAKSLETERKDRLGNVRYVVDSVNTVNTDIFNTFNSNVARQNEQVAAATARTSNLSSGLDSFFKLTGAGGNAITFGSLPGTVPVTDMGLIKHVTAISGMTIKDLSSSNNQFTMCGTGTNPRCIRFPDSDGNTYITNLQSDKGILMDGPTTMTGPLTMKYGAGGPAVTMATSNTGSLNVTANSLKINPAGVGPFVQDAMLPEANTDPVLDIQSFDLSKNSLRVSTGLTSQSMVVTANGDIILGGNHVIGTFPRGMSGDSDLVIYPGLGSSIRSGNQGNLSTLYIAGNVRVAGQFTSNIGMQNLFSQAPVPTTPTPVPVPTTPTPVPVPTTPTPVV